MSTFLMDAGSFSGGECDGTRVVPGAGVGTDFAEFDADADTLALWHLHDGGCAGEGTGLGDHSGHGHTLANHGAEAIEDGYHLVRSETDYLTAGLGAQPSHAGLTIEAWVRAWAVPAGSYAQLFRLAGDNGDLLNLEVLLNADNTATLRAYYQVASELAGFMAWTSAATKALLTGTDPWHVALVVQAPNWVRLYVNGAQRAEDASGIVAVRPTGCTFYLGHPSSSAAPSVVLDEVRVSSVARYTATFSPRRLRSTGQYSSPVLDTSRLGSRWVDFESERTEPSGTHVAWDVRAANLLGTDGRPVADWQAYAGSPASLPSGRFLQWRATLAAAPDGLLGPTLASVTARSSDAGYNLYLATGPSPDALAYDEPFLRAGPGVVEIQTPPLEAGAVHWLGIRPANADGIETPVTDGEVRIEIAPSGERVAERPTGVLDLTASPAASGRVTLMWRYRVGLSGIVPETFQVFGDAGSGTIDYGTPIGEVPYQTACVWYRWTSEPLPNGVAHTLSVRALAAGGLSDEQPAVVTAIPDSAAPGEVSGLQVEVIL